jgi:hypothetical protein
MPPQGENMPTKVPNRDVRTGVINKILCNANAWFFIPWHMDMEEEEEEEEGISIKRGTLVLQSKAGCLHQATWRRHDDALDGALDGNESQCDSSV